MGVWCSPTGLRHPASSQTTGVRGLLGSRASSACKMSETFMWYWNNIRHPVADGHRLGYGGGAGGTPALPTGIRIKHALHTAPPVSGRLRSGFTLVEMLLVIGILGILATALVGSFSYVQKAARQSQAQSLASELATALNIYLQQERSWGDVLPNKSEMDEEACWVLQEKKLFDVTTYKSGGAEINNDSLDRYGLLDPYGRALLRRDPGINAGEVIKHRLQIRLDDDYDGYVEAPDGTKVRASVLVWSRGPDGKDDAEKGGRRYPDDDRLSWNHGKARAETGK